MCAGGYNLACDRPLVFERAISLVQLVQNHQAYQNLDLVLTGQSFGGGLASSTALKIDGCRAICFNSLPLGPWAQLEISPLTEHKITQVTVVGDWLSDNPFLRWMPAVLPGKSGLLSLQLIPEMSMKPMNISSEVFLNTLA